MQTLSTVLVVLSWLAALLLIIGACLAVYVWARARRTNDPWGWREIGEEHDQEEKE